MLSVEGPLPEHAHVKLAIAANASVPPFWAVGAFGPKRTLAGRRDAGVLLSLCGH